MVYDGRWLVGKAAVVLLGAVSDGLSRGFNRLLEIESDFIVVDHVSIIDDCHRKQMSLIDDVFGL
jgi:hypothetical protein